MIKNSIVVVLFLILLCILVVVIIYNYTINNKIEKFYDIPINLGRIPLESSHINTVKETTVSVDPTQYFNGYNIAETCTDNKTYDAYTVVSSFNYRDLSSDSILGTLNNDNTNTIYLTNTNTSVSYFNVNSFDVSPNGSSNFSIKPVFGGNYIAIFFPHDNLYFNNLTMNFSASSINSANDIVLYTNVDNTYTHIPISTANVMNNNAITLTNNGFANDNIDNIIIYFPPSCTDVSLSKLNFMFNIQPASSVNYSTTTTDVMDSTVTLSTITTNFLSTNYNTNVSQFMSIFYTDVPKFIYDFGTIDGCGGSYTLNSDGVTVTSISDVFGRFSSTTNISGVNPVIVTEYDMNSNITGKYLKGTNNTNIIFPTGSIPQNYTICCITKYVPNGTTGRIITANNFNFLIGHWSSREGTIYNQNSPNTWIKWVDDDVNVNPSSSRRWIVTCIKSGGNGTNNIIINGVNVPGDGGSGYDKACMAINGYGLYSGEVSDFGIKYIFIWDKVLSDDKLKIISDNLNSMVNGNPIVFKIDRTKITINLKDGLSYSSAAGSAREIKSIYGTSKNGFYWIQVPNAGSRLTYCIMDDDVYGGGWMLAIQGSSKAATFHYYSPYWTNNYILNTSTINFTDSNGDVNLDNIIDAKYDLFNTMTVNDCLALFPASQTNNNTNIAGKPKYGWTWYTQNALGNYMGNTLLNFFSKGYTNFSYTTPCQGVRRYAGPGTYMDYNSFVTSVIDKYMPRSIWARESAFLAFGFNYKQIYSNGYSHNIRWGGSFNENYCNDFSNDVSGGIGMCAWGLNDGSAGSRINCCQDAGSPGARAMSFQWYIR